MLMRNPTHADGLRPHAGCARLESDALPRLQLSVGCVGDAARSHVEDRASVVRRNKSIAARMVEPLDGTHCHTESSNREMGQRRLGGSRGDGVGTTAS